MLVQIQQDYQTTLRKLNIPFTKVGRTKDIKDFVVLELRDDAVNKIKESVRVLNHLLNNFNRA